MIVCFTKCDEVWDLKAKAEKPEDKEQLTEILGPFIDKPKKTAFDWSTSSADQIVKLSDALSETVARKWPHTHDRLSSFGGLRFFQTSFYGSAPEADSAGKESLQSGESVGFLDPLTLLLSSR